MGQKTPTTPHTLDLRRTRVFCALPRLTRTRPLRKTARRAAGLLASNTVWGAAKSRAMRRRRSWAKRHPRRRIHSTYGGRGCFAPFHVLLGQDPFAKPLVAPQAYWPPTRSGARLRVERCGEGVHGPKDTL